jgi:hypothetical protein
MDVWKHVDGSQHSADGPLGCMPCANKRRAAMAPEAEPDRRVAKLQRLADAANEACASSVSVPLSDLLFVLAAARAGLL